MAESGPLRLELCQVKSGAFPPLEWHASHPDILNRRRHPASPPPAAPDSARVSVRLRKTSVNFKKRQSMNMLPSCSGLLDELFRDVSSPGFFIKPLHGEALPAQLKLDADETEAGYALQAGLAGVNKKDIPVEIDGPLVTIKAEVKQYDRRNADSRMLRSERCYGAVSGSVQRPADIDRDRD